MPPNGSSANGDAEYLLDFEKPLAQAMRLIAELEAEQASTGRSRAAEIRKQQAEYFRLLRNTYSHLSAWETVQVSRHPHRPLAGDHIAGIVKDFVELHGTSLARSPKTRFSASVSAGSPLGVAVPCVLT